MVFDGAFGLKDLETQYDIALPDDPAYATLGGFVLAQLGFIPRGGEAFDYGDYHFTVVEMDRRRVARVKIQGLVPLPVPAPVGSPPAGATGDSSPVANDGATSGSAISAAKSELALPGAGATRHQTDAPAETGDEISRMPGTRGEKQK